MARGKQTITLAIALDGGKEIEKELKALGPAGEEAFKRLQAAADGLKIDAKIEQGVNNIRASFTKLGASFQAVEAGIVRVAFRLGLLQAAVTAAAGSFLLLQQNGAKAAAEIGKQSAALGLTNTQYQALANFGSEAGVSAQQFGGAMRNLSQTIEAAAQRARASGGTLANGIRPAIETFAEGAVTVRRFGPDYAKAVTQVTDAYETFADKVTSKGTNALPATLRAMAVEFAKMPDGAQKTSFALKALGEDVGGLFLRKLNQGGAAFDAFVKDFEKNGIKLTDAEVELAIKQQIALNNLGDAFTNTKTKISVLFSPFLTELADQFTAAIVRNQDAIRALALEAIVPTLRVFNDLIDLFSGNVGQVRTPWILEWAVALERFKIAAQSAYQDVIKPFFNFVLVQAGRVSSVLNAVFGTSLSGGVLLAGAAFLRFTGILGLAVDSVKLLFVALGGLKNILLLLPRLLGWPALLVTGLIAAALNIEKIWPLIVAGAKATYDAIVKIFSGDFSGAFEGLKTESTATWAFIAAGALLAFRGLSIAVTAVGRIIGAALLAGVGFAFTPVGLAAILSAAAGAAIVIFWDELKALFLAGVEGFKSDFSALGDAIGSIFSTAADAVAAKFQQLYDAVAQVFANIGSLVTNVLSGALSLLDSLINKAVAAASAIANAAAAAFSGSAGDAASSDALGNSNGFASGGSVWGRGTGTSDSIPARLSNGEYVIREAVARRIRPFLNSLNFGGASAAVAKVRNGVRYLAQGGSVDFSGFNRSFQGAMQTGIPVMASPSVGGSGPTFTLAIEGQTFAGLTGPADVIGQLGRFAAQRNAQSMGRKPGWYGSR